MKSKDGKMRKLYKRKYGIDAKITEINCEKYSSSPVPDFSLLPPEMYS